MIAELENHRGELAELCARFGVRRLDVFGSAAEGAFDRERSDVDLLVEMGPSDEISRFDAFFGLKEALELLLGRHVDLVDPSALENPYFAASVERTRQGLYTA